MRHGAPAGGAGFDEGVLDFIDDFFKLDGDERSALIHEESRVIEELPGGLRKYHQEEEIPWGHPMFEELLPLFCAVKSGSIQAVNLLLESGADLEVEDECGCSIIFAAESVPMILFLQSLGFEIEAPGHQGRTPLMQALLWGKRARVAALLEAGANLNATSEFGETPFLAACYSVAPCLEDIRTLVSRGVDVHALDRNGCNALHRSVAAILDYDQIAAHLEITRYLVGLGVDLEVHNLNMLTPLGVAVDSEYASQVQNLLELGANPDARGRFTSCDPVGFAPDSFFFSPPLEPLIFHCLQPLEDSSEKLELLLQYGASINVVNAQRLTPLQVARQMLEKPGSESVSGNSWWVKTEQDDPLEPEEVEEIQRWISILEAATRNK